MTALGEIIADKIKAKGPVSFHDFMEEALYHPEHGYYSSGRRSVGMEGDFFTSATVSPVFGGLIGRQLLEMWDYCGPGDFTVVEYGAGSGALCKAILAFFSEETDRISKLRYIIIEKNPLSRKALEGHGSNLQFVDSLSQIGTFTGCVLCNELLDNFPVHRVVMQEELKEVFVDHQGGKFVEVHLPAASQLQQYFADLKVQLSPGFQTEVNLQAEQWISEIGLCMEKGFVLVIDYGYLSGELYSETRRLGTLVCYHNHSVNDRPYSEIGNQDITAHVNFSALGLFALRRGYQLCGFRDQGPFLRALGFMELLKQMREGDTVTPDEVKRENFLIHTLLGEMGHKMKVLILQKGMDKPDLQGMKRPSGT